ncbi:GNAT family N-acetyltransferase [Streptomyces buecherae]|uniref:GNAT family N-acetyltransferase n=1 Tax=Streptomyces buecherae TaxID=2763006 RepID=UPI003793B3B7
MITIRAFAETDRAGLGELFVRAGEGSPTASLWGHAASEAAVYLTPYLDHEPASCFVAERSGVLVGYLVGCLDGAAFPSEDERLARAVRAHRLLLRPGPVAFFARSLVDLARAKAGRSATAGELVDPRWPAHLHLNVAREARGTGAADELMRHWFARLRAAGSPGCHLQTLVENARAVRFFTRVGCVPHGPTPLVPGLRYQGGRLHQRTMVWNP